MLRNKKIFLLALLLLCAAGVSAQHYVGVRVGYGGGSTRIEPREDTGSLFGWPSGGLSWRYYSPVKYVGAIGADLQYVKTGYKRFYKGNKDSDTSYHRTVASIEMPFMWQPHVYLFNRRARAFVNLGVYVSYNIASDTLTVSKINGTLHEGKYPLRTVKDNIWGYGLCGGAGIGVFFDRFEVLIEARYNFGYNDLLKNFKKYPGNPKRSPVDMLNISVGVNYRLGKGGILSPPAVRKKKTIDPDLE